MTRKIPGVKGIDIFKSLNRSTRGSRKSRNCDPGKRDTFHMCVEPCVTYELLIKDTHLLNGRKVPDVTTVGL